MLFRSHVVQGITYFAEPEDMNPDKVPVLGFLDDAIMVELIVRELKHDIEAYEDFARLVKPKLAEIASPAEAP